MEPTVSYKQGLTYICVADCGTQITVDSVGQGGPITCCGQPMRRGRVLAVAPRGTGEREERLPTAYRLIAGEADFDVVAKGANKLVLVEFTAPWCGACKAMDPVLDELAIAHAGSLVLVEVDVDLSPGLPDRLGVRSVPSLLFLKDGEVKARLFGFARRERIEEVLQPLLFV